MKHLGKRFLAVAASLAMVVSMVPQGQMVYAAETEGEYEIYPTPRSVEYQEGSFVVRSNVNVVFESDIDEYTQDKLEDVLADKGITMSEAEEISDSTTNILVGIKDSGEYVDAYADANLSCEDALFEEIHAYALDINDGTITILGESTDSAFYGIVSLMHILNQLDGRTIRNLTIEDYADTATRGFIEGYYGLPWSNEDRMSLMEFGGQFKMTSYVFAPKDDPYHTSLWRSLYPENEIEKIAEMVEVGNASKCRFVWTAHPFMGGFNTGNVEGEIDALLAKFDQLYSVGVRQFGVLGDDVGNLNRSVVIQVMNAVSEWAAEKGDVYDSVFCPAGYNHSWQGNYSELNDYDAGFPDDVQIFWTGEAVCQPVEQKTLDHFRDHNATNGERRSPLFWLNWPVNDINMSRLMMGKGSLLRTDVNVEDLAGVVTNPMQDAEASKVAIFAVADYAWNVAEFDDDQSWADSFDYIDADASEELHTLAKHMSDPSPNGHGLVLAESEDLAPLLNAYVEKVENGSATADDHNAIIAEFEIIAEACDAFHEKSQNEKLKEELLPFTNSLKDQALAAIALVNTQKAVEDGNASEVWSNYSQGTALITSSKNHQRITLNGTQAALPGSKNITPFITNLSGLLAPVVNTMIDDSKQIVTFITNRTDTPDGALEKLTDNNELTEIIWKSPNYTTADTYIGLTYSKAITLNNVTFKMGQSGNERDTFDAGKLQYTVDGKNWVDIEGTEFTTRVNNVTAENLNLEVKGIRIISTADKENMWLGCKDIVVNAGSGDSGSDAPITISGTGIYNTENMGVETGNLGMYTDGSVGDYIGFGYIDGGDYTVADAWVGLQFEQTEEINAVTIVQGTGDHIDNGTLEYLNENNVWTKIDTYSGIGEVFSAEFDTVQAKAVRLVNNAQKAIWWRIYEFTVEKRAVEETEIFTNIANIPELTQENGTDTTTLTGSAQITFAPGEYLGVKLNRIKDITNITTSQAGALTLESSKNNVIWTAVGDTYEDARYVRLINNTTSDIKINFGELTVESFEIEPVSVESTNFGQQDTHVNAFDQDRTTEAVLQSSQVAGRYVTYDLGQVINLDSLKLVLHDGTTDYPRHAKVSVSEDGTTWEDVMLIGSQDSANAGEAENTDNISELFPVHEISYYTLEETGIDKDVRYIKFEITRTKVGADKWVRIREIELNGGNMYLASENNPTIVLAGEESTGNVKTNMIDGDVLTTFKSASDEAGSFTYYISENTNISKINILQSPATISGAKVSAEVVKNQNTRSTGVETVELGALNSSMNEFNTTAFEHVLSVTVEWETGKAPEIHEIITLNTEVKVADKTELQNYYNSVKDTDTSTWTDGSKAAFEDALDLAEYVLANEYVTESSVASALAELTAAVENKVVKPDMAAFEAAVAEVVKDVQDEEDYIARTWSLYAEAMAAVEAAKTNAEISQAELDEILASVTAAVDGLVYEVTSIEALAVLAADAKEQYAKDDYDETAFAALTKAIEDADAMIEADAKERQNPDDVKECLAALEAAIKALDQENPDPTVTPGPTTPPDKFKFDDVQNAKEFYYEPVYWAYDNKITTGVTSKLFKPNDPCSRGQIITFIWRAEGEPESTITEVTFKDVDAKQFYYESMLWGVEKGIINGLTETKFGPDDTCTRGQLVTMLWRANGKPEAENKEHSFTDVDAGQFYYEPMLWAVEEEITKGQTSTEFAPDANVNRGETVTFLYRAYAK